MMTAAALSKEDIRAHALANGVDLVGFCRWNDLEADAPVYDRPSTISSSLQTLIVLVRRIPAGVSACTDDAMVQYNNGRTARYLEEDTGHLAYWLESQGLMACIVMTTIPDTRSQPLSYSAPAGQGSKLLKQAAVRAGLGSLGINTMLLTEQFGPRVFISGVLTDLDVEADSPFESDLCPGAQACGLCIPACPVKAISSEGSDAFNADSCGKNCQPHGPERTVEHLKAIFNEQDLDKRKSLARSSKTLKIWHNMSILRQGGFTGCMRCEQACPVGADFALVQANRSGA